MKYLIVVLMLSMLGIQSANAAKLRGVSVVKSAKLEKIAQVYASAVAGIDDSGSSRVKVLEKRTDEKWENTIKQMIRRNEYVQEAGAEVVRKSEGAIAYAFNEVLNTANPYLSESEHVRAEVRRQVLPLILKATIANPNILVYAANFSGEFDGAYLSLVLVDTRTNEIISLYAGYSE